MSYQEYKNSVLGRGFNIDGAYGNQCWDGYAHYCRYLGVPFANCTVTGYVRDLWEQRQRNGILKYFDEVSVMKPGDIAIFKVHPSTPYSHVAIFDSDAGGGYGWFLGQNQGGPNGNYNVIKFPYAATYDTAFRLKGSQQPKPQQATSSGVPSDAIAERGTFTVSISVPIKIRNAPSVTGQDTGFVYAKGQSVNYDYYVKREGYCWISWVSHSGVRRWMATGELDARGRNSNPWGTFR